MSVTRLARMCLLCDLLLVVLGSEHAGEPIFDECLLQRAVVDALGKLVAL